MTRPGLAGRVPAGVRVTVAELPPRVAALAVATRGGAAIVVNRSLGGRARGSALARALSALAAPRPADLPFAGVVDLRPEWARERAR